MASHHTRLDTAMNGTRWTRNPDHPTSEPMRPRIPDARYLTRSRNERDSRGGAA